MHDIFDAGGALVASIPLSDMMRERVESGELVEVQFHMPKALRSLGREHVDGTFSVSKVENNYVTDDPASCRAYAEIAAAVSRLR